jgi:hypothetical protein
VPQLQYLRKRSRRGSASTSRKKWKMYVQAIRDLLKHFPADKIQHWFGLSALRCEHIHAQVFGEFLTEEVAREFLLELLKSGQQEMNILYDEYSRLLSLCDALDADSVTAKLLAEIDAKLQQYEKAEAELWRAETATYLHKAEDALREELKDRAEGNTQPQFFLFLRRTL